MISRFIFWTVVFVIVGGFFIHFDVDIPYLMEWLGRLPGDMHIKKDDTFIYLPVTSAALVSLAFSFILTIFRKKK
jgi:hypothetical protein